MEFNVPRNVEIDSTQELGVDPSQSDGNPLDIQYASGGSRRRVIGTGEMTLEGGAEIGDAFGYAFWSTGNFAKYLAKEKYLSVDGVDPLNYSWYRSKRNLPRLRLPLQGADSIRQHPERFVPNLVHPAGRDQPADSGWRLQADQDRAVHGHAGFPNIVPYSSMKVFRSHYDRPGEAAPASNGNAGEPTESGGDVGGAVLSIQARARISSPTPARSSCS